MASNDHAIVVGINRYSHISDLNGPVNDAMCFRDWLVAPDGGDVPKDHITVILSASDAPHACPDPSLPADAILPEVDYAQVEAAFDKLIELANETGERVGRRLYVFFAGHGLGPTPNETVVLMSRADYGQRRGFHIPGRTYIEVFRTGALFEELVLFMDCCRDSLANVTLKLPPWYIPPDAAGADVRYCFAFSTKWARKARERPAPGSDHVHGVFTHALLDALKRCPANAQGEVLASTISGYVREELEKLEEDGFFNPGEFQTRKPEFFYPEDTDFVFLERDVIVETPVRITFTAPQEGFAAVLRSYEYVDGDFKFVDKLDPMTGVWELQLPAGTYLIQVVDKATQYIARQKPFPVTGQEVNDVSF